MQDRDRPAWCGANLAKHRAHARRSQAAFYVPRFRAAQITSRQLFFSHLASCPGCDKMRSGSAWNGLSFPRNETRYSLASHRPKRLT